MNNEQDLTDMRIRRLAALDQLLPTTTNRAVPRPLVQQVAVKGGRPAGGGGSKTIVHYDELHVTLPSREISEEQFIEFIRVKIIGVEELTGEIEVRHFNKNFAKEGDSNFCFLRCNCTETKEYVFERMDGLDIGDYPEGIRVRRVDNDNNR